MEQLPHIHVARCVCARLLSVLSCMVLLIPVFCGAQEWDETLFSVQLSGDAKAAIPTRGGVVTIPEPAFLVCLAQSDPALAPAPLGAHAVAVFNWKSGIMVVGNHVDGGRTVLERFSAVPLARLLAPERRAGWNEGGACSAGPLGIADGGRLAFCYR
jgi:hypothetical protein